MVAGIIQRELLTRSRWICIRIESLGGLFAASLAAYLIYGGRVEASDTGFSLTMAGTTSCSCAHILYVLTFLKSPSAV